LTSAAGRGILGLSRGKGARCTLTLQRSTCKLGIANSPASSVRLVFPRDDGCPKAGLLLWR